MPYLLLPLLLLLSLPAHAVVQKFGANEHNTVWLNEGDNKFHCSLKQTIPNFGQAVFGRIAGDKLQLKFELLHPNRAEQEVELLSHPPLWRHERSSRLLDTLQLNEPTTEVAFDSQQARVALTELEQGLFPTIRYHIKDDDNREVNAAISSVNFRPSYNQFLTCLSQLMPYQFDYVKDSKFYFLPGKNVLTARHKRRLNEIIRYIKADRTIKWMHIKGYTDSKGFRHINDKVAIQRIKIIQNYLASQGVDNLEIDISTKAYGERMPIVSNRTPQGRAKNRVAIFTLFNKEPPPPEELPEFEFENIFYTLPGEDPKYKPLLPQVIPKQTPRAEAVLEKIPEAAPEADAVLEKIPEAAPKAEAILEKIPETAPGKVEEPPPPITKAEVPSTSAPLFAPITQEMVESGK